MNGSAANQSAKDWQNKVKAYEQDIHQLAEEKDLLERQFRQAQTERNELQQELNVLTREWFELTSIGNRSLLF